jgi:cation diffusion facilitator family transporter
MSLKSKVNSLRVVLIISAGLTLVKFYTYYLTHSYAVLSDAFESIINIAATGFALYSVTYAARLKDADHPYGHGKMEYVAAGFEGALIFFTGIYIFINAIFSLINGKTIHHIEEGIVLTAITTLILLAMGLHVLSKGKKLQSFVMIADGKHILTDVATSAGLVFALLLYKFTQFVWIDGLVALLLSIFILFNGYKLIKESLNNLMDRADVTLIEKIAASLQSIRRDKWIDIHNLRMQKFGRYIHIDCHMTFPFYETLETVHDEIKLLERQLNKTTNYTVELFIHTDPCEQKPCSICAIGNCNFRKKDFVKEIIWTRENIMVNKKHSL